VVNVDEVAQAAHIGRVGTLLLAAERELPGKLDASDGRPCPAEASHPDVDDMLDDLAEKVLLQKGSVFVVPAGCMPSDTGLAAIYRY
jgi:hypothetical protein